MAFVQERLGLQEAEESFKTYRELKKDDMKALEKADKIREEGKMQAEIDRRTKLIEDQKSDSEAKVQAYWDRACAYGKMGVEHCALRDCRIITELESKNSEVKKQAWYFLGTISEERGNF